MLKACLRKKLTPAYIKLDFVTIFWLFFFASILGLLLETAYHALVFGGYQDRAGLVWGPFSPIYGAGAVALTVLLNRFYYTHNIVVFLASMVIGASIEYWTSWGMQYFFGAIAWDYTGSFGSIQGRTNLLFGTMWGILGLAWVRLALPQIKHLTKKYEQKTLSLKLITWACAAFMLFNAVITCAALNRQAQRMEGIPATNEIDRILDKDFPDSWMKNRFQNMSVDVSKKGQSGL